MNAKLLLLKSFLKFLPDFIQEKKKKKKYNKMKKAELEKLSDEDLYSAISARMMAEPCYFQTEEAVKNFIGVKRVFYILDTFDAEIQNGGLCQFFSNSSSAAAPYISECLGTVHADEYRKNFDEFVSRNGINLSDLSQFECNELKDFDRLKEKYSIDEFDNSYYSLYERNPLNIYVARYVRQNIDEFC